MRIEHAGENRIPESLRTTFWETQRSRAGTKGRSRKLVLKETMLDIPAETREAKRSVFVQEEKWG